MSEHTRGPWWIELGRPIHIDKVDTAPNQKDGTRTANARLIAAAPEMLEALVKALPEIDCKTCSGDDAREAVQSAIAKATGDTK